MHLNTARTVTLLLTVLLCSTTTACNHDGIQVPSGAYCDPVANWPSERQAIESKMLTLFNRARAVGATCGSNGYYGPAGALYMDPALRCASRVHSMDMHDRNFFEHTNLDGESPWDRFARAGWTGSGGGENIIAGHGSAQASFDGWMDSDGHCANIMNPSFNRVGIGWFLGDSGFRDYGTAGFGVQ